MNNRYYVSLQRYSSRMRIVEIATERDPEPPKSNALIATNELVSKLIGWYTCPICATEAAKILREKWQQLKPNILGEIWLAFGSPGDRQSDIIELQVSPDSIKENIGSAEEWAMHEKWFNERDEAE